MIRIHMTLTGVVCGRSHTTTGFFSEEAIRDIEQKLKARIKSGDRLKDISVSVNLHNDIWDGEYKLVVERVITLTGDLKTTVALIGDAINHFTNEYSSVGNVSIRIEEIRSEEI